MEQSRLSLREKIIYSVGNGGIGVFMGLHMWYLVYFFFPPKDTGIDYVIPQKSFFLGLTILGLIIAVSRIIDAVTDPIIANYSDNYQHKLGKRIPFMRRYAIFLAITYVAVFWIPMPDQISNLNVIWLAVILILTALGMTLYSVPFYSLVIEIAKHPEDKIDLGTFNSAFWFVGFLLTSFLTSLWQPLQTIFDMGVIKSLQVSFAIAGALGVVLLFIPAFCIDERKYRDESKLIGAQEEVSKHKKQALVPSMKKVMSNKNFTRFICANTFYTVATYMFETGLIYFITVLAMQKASLQGPLTTIIGGATLLSYPFINKLTKKKGKKFIMILGFILFGLSFIVITLFGVKGLPIFLLMGILGLLAPLPQAIFGILPTVMVADCAAYDHYKTGEDNGAMYVAVSYFFSKIGYSIATILFTSLLLFGKDPGQDLGIRLTTILGAVLAFLSIGLIIKYNEKEVMSYTKAYNKESEDQEANSQSSQTMKQ